MSIQRNLRVVALKKVYNITPKGQDTLKIMIEKHVQMKESMNSLFASTLGFEDGIEDDIQEGIQEFLKFGPFEIIFGSLKEKPLEEQIQILEFQKHFILQQQIEFKNHIEGIDKALSNLKEKQEKK